MGVRRERHGERTRKRLKYQFDNFIAAGTAALIGSLAAATCVLVLLAGVLLVATGANPPGERLSTVEAVWASLMRALDPGTMGADRGWAFRLVMLGVTLGGILLLSTLIAVLNSAFTLKYERLQRGRTWIIEKRHVVILGWSEVVFAVVQQLAEAAKTRNRPLPVIILADRDPMQMREDIIRKGRLNRKVRVICSRGLGTSLGDLKRVTLTEASSVIVLADQAGADDHSVRALLAVRRACEQAETPRVDLHIAVELKAKARLEDLLLSIGEERAGDYLHVVKSDQLLARVLVQSSRQSGLSHVYSELLSFEGNEIYARDLPAEFVGRPFGDLATAFENAVPIGFLRGKRPRLQPALDEPALAGDQLIVVAETMEDGLRPASAPRTAAAVSSADRRAEPEEPPENILVLGWNERGAQVIQDLSRYAPPGSEVEVIFDAAATADDAQRMCGRQGNARVTCRTGATHTAAALQSFGLSARQRLIVLGYTERLTREQADTRTLLTLQHIRKLLGPGPQRPTIVSEMLDVRNRELADDDGSDDFVVSDHLISLKLAQVAENNCAREVLDQLLSPDGSEVYMRPAHLFAPLGEAVSFASVQEAALARDEIALGYRLFKERLHRTHGHGVHLNPGHKAARTLCFGPDDKVVVVARS